MINSLPLHGILECCQFIRYNTVGALFSRGIESLVSLSFSIYLHIIFCCPELSSEISIYNCNSQKLKKTWCIQFDARTVPIDYF